VRCRVLVNASGPWVGELSASMLPQIPRHDVRLVKGCHIIVPKLHDKPEAFLLQSSDGRVVFVIPYQQDFSLIGTTEEDFHGDPSTVQISEWEVEYLVNIVNECFRARITAADVVHHFAGVRPLLGSDEANASKVSRDYTLELAIEPAPVLTVYGGKITTYRSLAESALAKLQPLFPQMREAWTELAPLPGGEFSSPVALLTEFGKTWPWVPGDLLQRWACSYGIRTRQLLESCPALSALGQDFGGGLYAREVDYLCDFEWAESVEDILWRRTKLGLRFSAAQREALSRYLATRRT